MEHKDHDKVFFATFGSVMAGLFAIFFICIIAARMLVADGVQPDPAQRELLQSRIEPIGAVITDPAALVKVSAASPARAALSGEQVNAQLCAGCHAAGVLGAPRTGDKAAWSGRMGAGLDALVAAAIAGKNAMPPRGGDNRLSDEEVRAAVEHMLRQSGV